MPEPAARDQKLWRRLGFTALFIGLFLIALMEAKEIDGLRVGRIQFGGVTRGVPGLRA